MKCGVIQCKFTTPPTPPPPATLCAQMFVAISLLWHQRNYPPHQIISYISHPTDSRAPAALHILFMTFSIICLCADLSAPVAPLLHIVRGDPRMHHFLYYNELCMSLLYETGHVCVDLTSWMCRLRQRNANGHLCRRLLTTFYFVVISDVVFAHGHEGSYTAAQTWASLMVKFDNNSRFIHSKRIACI